MPRHNALFHNSRIVFIIEIIKHLEKQAYKFKNKNNIVYKIVFFSNYLYDDLNKKIFIIKTS